jgi:hypothetical protein
MRFPALALAALLLAAPASAEDAALSQWVQFVPGGGQEARVVTSAAACPALTVDGASVAMAERAPPNANFPVRLCSLVIPPKANAVSLGGTALPFVTKTPQRIMVFGDTGCRIKGKAIQTCNDPERWPFPQIAAQAAKLKPDIVIHVGDYL